MSDGEIDYAAVLSDLKARRDKLDAAISGIEAVIGIRASESAGTPSPNGGRSEVAGEGAFLGMSIVDATVKLLRVSRKTLRNEEIFQALKSGGLVFTSDNPPSTIGSILHRNWNGGGEVVRVSRGVWGLAEWHPRLRKRHEGSDKASEGNDEPT